MSESNTSRRVTQYAQATWRRVHELDLLATPENYSLLFAYFEEADTQLKMAVEEALKMSGRDPIRLAEVFSALYERFLTNSRQEQVLQGTTGKIDEEIQQMLSMVSAASKGNEQYGQVLNTFTNDLNKKNVSVDQMQTMISRLQQETKTVAEQNNKLREQLFASLTQVKDLRSNLDNVKKESITDALTGIGNRKAFTAEMHKVIQETVKKGETLCVIMIDIDHFKKFNDKYGHLVGDQVLKLVATTLKENIKGRDFVARWGGEEFGLLLPNTSLSDAVVLGDQLRLTVASKKIIRKPQNEDLGTITLSMGTTTFIYGENPNDFVDRADQALYRAKQEGRNRIVPQAPPIRAAMAAVKSAPPPEEDIAIVG